VLASGLGLASVSPWDSGAAATTVTAATGIGLVVVQWLSSAMGGYITGRLRANWVGVHTHEVFFRDTAHGFLTWAVATIVGVVLSASLASSIIGGGVHAAASVAAGAGSAATAAVTPYDLDTLFRGNGTGDSSGNWRGEAARILGHGLQTGDVSQGDRGFLAQLVAAHAGISQQEAQQRVDGVIAQEKSAAQQAKAAADAARKAASAASIFMALAMMVGAFIASAAAAYGGGSRDKYLPHA
jgi:hypothetical protein